jgi:protein-S-isoprenylcysteine O-methyltransferase Ste14
MESELSMGIALDYGHWGAVLLQVVIWVLPTFFWLRPRQPRETLAFGIFCLFMVDEFIELYGFPYTLMLFSSQVAAYADEDGLSYRAGDLWRVLLKQDSYQEVNDYYHLFAGIFIFGGMGLLYFAWRTLRDARLSNVPATTGPYAWFRHPQYLAIMSVMLGYIIQGPTLPTLAIFPLLTLLYVVLAKREEKELLTQFGNAYALYMKRAPGFAFWRQSS